MFRTHIVAIFFCLFAVSTMCDLAFAAQWAIVGKEKAVIYSDPEMTSPIGYVGRGKKVRVGEVKRNKGRMLPIVVNGKIAYIRVSDIYTSENEQLLEGVTQRFNESIKPEEPFKLEVNYSYFNSTYSVDSTLTNEPQQVFNMGGITIKGHVMQEDKNSYRVGINIMEGFNDMERIKIISLDIDKAFNLFYAKRFISHFFVGINAVPWCEYKFEDLFVKNGFGLGAYAGADLIYNMSSKYSLHLDLRYQGTVLRGVQIPDELNTTWEPSFIGASGSLGISYLF